jgi:hydrogenase-4 component B
MGIHSQMTSRLMSESLVLLGIIIAATSGLPGFLWGRMSMSGQWVTTLLAVLGAGLGLAGAGSFWATGVNQPIVFSWSLRGAEFSVAIDGLSAIFLVPIFLVSLLGNVYGLGYWKQTEHPRNGRKLRLFHGTLTAGMALLVVSRNSIIFLFAWEIMGLSTFFLIATEDQDKDACEAGWLYLIVTHLATLCLFALFGLLGAASGSFALGPLQRNSISPGMATTILILALAGFGSKAGIMPLHVWLPSAHAVAPSHVSEIMSGVNIKIGIYGLLRVTSVLGNVPPAWGVIFLVLGVISGVFGVAFAIGQQDLKRLLAYHSIENIGIIIMGIGLAMIGSSLGRGDLIILGMSGSLLHVWNHALFKALLFLSAGSVIHSAHTREIDQLGGLAKTMPWTSVYFLVGSVAICGLPPLNGFVSEFLVYLRLLATLVPRDGPAYAGPDFAAPALALIGALAVACFVKVYGAVFLGSARSKHAQQGHESPVSMLAPMGVLVACCFLIGLALLLVVSVLQQGISAWAPGTLETGRRLLELAPLGQIMSMGFLLVGLLSFAAVVLWMLLGRTAVDADATWDCGYLAKSSSMQYTSSSFAQMLVGLFGWMLRPRSRVPKNLALFPRQAEFHSEVPDVVLTDVVLPAFRGSAWLLSWFRILQQGNIQIYVLYIFLALIALLLWR